MDQITVENETGTGNVQQLPATDDKYGGVVVELEEYMDSDVFRTLLKTSMTQWKLQGKKGVWIKLPIELSHLVDIAVKEGFWYHHAEPKYLMLLNWIPKTINPPELLMAALMAEIGSTTEKGESSRMGKRKYRDSSTVSKVSDNSPERSTSSIKFFETLLNLIKDTIAPKNPNILASLEARVASTTYRTGAVVKNLQEAMNAVWAVQLPTQMRDPGPFGIECYIRNLHFLKALLDLGSGESFITYAAYQHLYKGRYKDKPSAWTLPNGSHMKTVRVMKGILVQVGNAFFPIDLHILDDLADPNNPPTHSLVLGRDFIATSDAVIDMSGGKITISGNFDIELSYFKDEGYELQDYQVLPIDDGYNTANFEEDNVYGGDGNGDSDCDREIEYHHFFPEEEDDSGDEGSENSDDDKEEKEDEEEGEVKVENANMVKDLPVVDKISDEDDDLDIIGISSDEEEEEIKGDVDEKMIDIEEVEDDLDRITLAEFKKKFNARHLRNGKEY